MINAIEKGGVENLVSYRAKVDSELGHIKEFAANKADPSLSLNPDFTLEASRSSITKMTDALLNYKVSCGSNN